jgi:hypothetical protein
VLRGAVALGGAAALGGVGAELLSPASAALAGPAGFPTYQYIGVPFDKSKLRYNPTNELIFPCIRGVYDKIAAPRARYYLYYAPHEKPGGICLSYGNTLGGPFTEYPSNPIIKNVWAPHYNVSHVSSPHVIWIPETKLFHLYYHGENTTTRLATSPDGINFSYYGSVLTTANIPNSTETSYARVFAHQVPGLGNNYVIMFMGVTGGTRKIFWGWSKDAKKFTYDPVPLVTPGPDGQVDIAGPTLVKRNGTSYIIYHGNRGNMFITEVGNGFDKEVHLGVFHTALTGAPDNGRSASPSFGTDNGVDYMYYEAGQRLSATIAVARAV